MAEKKITEKMAAAKKKTELDRLLATIRQLSDADLEAMQASVGELLQVRGRKSKGPQIRRLR